MSVAFFYMKYTQEAIILPHQNTIPCISHSPVVLPIYDYKQKNKQAEKKKLKQPTGILI